MPNQPTDNNVELIERFLDGATAGHSENLYLSSGYLRLFRSDDPEVSGRYIVQRTVYGLECDLREDHILSYNNTNQIDFYDEVRYAFVSRQMGIPTRAGGWSNTRRRRPRRSFVSDTFEPLTRENDGI